MNTATTVPRILVDSSARKNGALIGRALEERSTIMWGDIEVRAKVTRLQARVFDRNAHWLRGQLLFLPAVTTAMRTGQFEAFTSVELIHEGARMARCANLRGDLWAGVYFSHVDSPLERSTWMGGLTFEQVFSGNHQQQFCERLLHYAREGVPQVLLDVLELDDFQRENLARLGEYRILCEAVGSKRYRDAFHLWTALCNGLEYFLTTDEKFLRILRRECDREDLARPAVSPFELAKVFDLPFEPPPVLEGEIVPYSLDR